MVGSTDSLRSRRITLTGASRGLGRAIAIAFQQAGADMLLLARHSPEFDQVSHELLALAQPGQSIETSAVDLSDVEAATAIIGFYRPDVLVNNAADQGPIGPIWQNQAAEWRQTIAVDLVAPAMLMAAALPAMIERQRGSIINIGGGGASRSRPNFSAYAAAKAGLVRLTESVADEVRRYGIAVTAIAPGALPTQMLSQIVAAGDSRAGAEEVGACHHVLKMPPDEIEAAFREVTDFCVHLAERPRMRLSGRLIAPRWDDWRTEALGSEMFTLRRVEPHRTSVDP